MVVDIERAQELLPVPRPLEPEIRKGPLELVDDPLLHEFLERSRAVAQGRQVVHREPGHDREEQPAAPKPLVDEVLGVIRIVFENRFENGAPDLSVAGFVGLDALDHLLEHPVAHAVGHRGQADELQVCEAGFEDEIGPDGELDRVRGDQELVDEVTSGDGDPVVRVEELVRPIELRIPGHQFMHQQEWDLRVPELIERPERRRSPPRAVASEPAGAQVADDCGELRQRKSRCVELDGIQPAGIEFLEVLDPADRVPHSVNGSILCVLVRDILAVGGPVRFIPALPLGLRQPGTAARRFREGLFLVDVRELPVELAGQIEPLVALQHESLLGWTN